MNRTVLADDNYIRESILNPNAKIVSGFQPIMPTFQGVVKEDESGAVDRLYQIDAHRGCRAHQQPHLARHDSRQ